MIVLDASAATEIVMRSDEGVALENLIDNAEKVVTCDLYHAEMTNVMRRSYHAKKFNNEEAQSRLYEAMALIDDFYPLDDLQFEVLRESIRLQHSSYDIFYLVLARRINATLVTTDKRLSQLCLQNGVDAVGVMDLPQD